MKTINRSYKFELRPTAAQKVLLEKHFGCVRWVYNHFLNEKIEQYSDTKKSDRYNKQAATLTNLKKEEEFIWLNEVSIIALQQSLIHLDDAYQNYFKGKCKFPNFKSKKGKNTYTVINNIKLKNKRIHIPKFQDGIKINAHREIKGKIGQCTVSKTTTGKYFISIKSEEIYESKPKTGKVCGIDLGLTDFVITSDGIKFKNNKYTKQYEKKLATAQKHLSRKVKGSNSYEKQRRKVALIYEEISNSRKDNLHKVSNQLITEYDTIAIENLHVNGMIKNRKLAKHITDASWGTFVTFLTYKADWNDREIIKIDRWFPSSKKCSECGNINKELKLSDRMWVCECGASHDRDINAAKNILSEGLKITSSRTGDNEGGVINQTSAKKRKTKKPEIQMLLANG